MSLKLAAFGSEPFKSTPTSSDMGNGIIRTSAMRAKKKETARVRYSAAYFKGQALIA